MEPHPEQVDPQPDRSRRVLLVGGLVALVVMVVVLLHLLGVIHG
jgi:hypothetical protein